MLRNGARPLSFRAEWKSCGLGRESAAPLRVAVCRAPASGCLSTRARWWAGSVAAFCVRAAMSHWLFFLGYGYVIS
jgi:hypothetical protein